MNSKAVLKFIFETTVCGLIGLAIAILFYNAL
jgi:hypothetical protein